MVGYTTCLAAGLARQCMLSPGQPDIESGIRSGLAAMRTLHLDGYGERGVPASQAGLLFPIARVASSLAGPVNHFAVAAVQDPMRFIHPGAASAEKPLKEGFWTILQDKFRGGLDPVAMQVVLEGPESALQGVPWGQFGNLLTVDRQEIESYRSIRNLVAEYAGKSRSRALFRSQSSGRPGRANPSVSPRWPDRSCPARSNPSPSTFPNSILPMIYYLLCIKYATWA
jgi:hypothetical protein